MSELCPDCVADLSLGAPSFARWIGADGNFCSIHFIRRYGHGSKLVPIEGYESPAEMKPPLPPEPPPTVVAADEVSA